MCLFWGRTTAQTELVFISILRWAVTCRRREYCIPSSQIPPDATNRIERQDEQGREAKVHPTCSRSCHISQADIVANGTKLHTKTDPSSSRQAVVLITIKVIDDDYQQHEGLSLKETLSVIQNVAYPSFPRASEAGDG